MRIPQPAPYRYNKKKRGMDWSWFQHGLISRSTPVQIRLPRPKSQFAGWCRSSILGSYPRDRRCKSGPRYHFSGCSSVWFQSAWFGTMRSVVQVHSPRPFNSCMKNTGCTFWAVQSRPAVKVGIRLDILRE